MLYPNKKKNPLINVAANGGLEYGGFEFGGTKILPTYLKKKERNAKTKEITKGFKTTRDN
jgi:hypothetical protein